MRDAAFAQLGFDFSDTTGVAASSPSPVEQQPLVSLLSLGSVPTETVGPTVEPSRDRPARGRSATRARTAVLFSRLQDLGLRGVETLVLMRTRTVMVSLIGRTLRVNEGYAEAPEPVLRAIVTFATSRTKVARATARDAILQFEIDRAPAPRRVEPPRPGDLALMAQLSEAHRQLNAQHFQGALTTIPIRLSGRMATRLGHFDPGSKHVVSEIVLSRQHVVKHGWREAMHTLLHEMVHQWQHETGAPVDHLAGFRKKAREVGITPAARRDVVPLERRRRRSAGLE
ncbi:MAG: SprT-like domain-containing protein [Gemmatimonadaceae bacterium]|nr:SprT-like domain-containing protein [Gemmatimonadaceae bacterium]